MPSCSAAVAGAERAGGVAEPGWHRHARRRGAHHRGLGQPHLGDEGGLDLLDGGLIGRLVHGCADGRRTGRSAAHLPPR